MFEASRMSALKASLAKAPPRSVLVTGAGGMLGRAFARVFADWYPTAKVFPLKRSDLDVSRREEVLAYSSLQPDDWILHCAALVSVEKCELNPELAEREIVGGTQNIIDLSNRVGAKLFYPQSFLIYDGATNPIDESVPPSPLSRYGQAKYEAELRIVNQAPNSLVVRMAGFFGGDAADKNFVGAIVPKIYSEMISGKTEFEVGDRTWQPTWTMDLAMNSLLLMGSGKAGLFQMSCHGTATFYDLAVAIAEELGWDTRITIKKVAAQTIAKREIGRRPEIAVLENRRLKKEDLDLQRPWRESLKEYLSGPYFEKYRLTSMKGN